MVLGIFKIALSLRDGMFSYYNQWEPLETKTCFKKLERRFFVESTKIENHFNTKLPYQNPMLRQIVWSVQNGPITKNAVLPVST